MANALKLALVDEVYLFVEFGTSFRTMFVNLKKKFLTNSRQLQQVTIINFQLCL